MISEAYKRRTSSEVRYNPLRDLFAVVTVNEAAKRWNKHRNSVLEAMIQGKLDHRRSEGTWLITTESLIKLWGKPEPANLMECEFVLPIYRKMTE